MAAYMIAFLDVKDASQYAAYAKHTPRVLAQYGGRMIVRGGDPATIEGQPPGSRCVVVEFADRAAIDRFYKSPEYQAILPLRLAAATGHVITVDGFAPDLWSAAVRESQKYG